MSEQTVSSLPSDTQTFNRLHAATHAYIAGDHATLARLDDLWNAEESRFTNIHDDAAGDVSLAR